MAVKGECSACTYEAEHNIKIDASIGAGKWEAATGISRFTVRRHLNHEAPPEDGITETAEDSSTGKKEWTLRRDRALTIEDAREWLRSTGDDPDRWNVAVRTIAYGDGKWSNKLSAWPKGSAAGDPEWPVIQPAKPVHLPPLSATITPVTRLGGLKCALKAGDTQIGFRVLPDGSLDPFHDERAMDVFIAAVLTYQPDKVTILGDFLDLPSQSRWAQEAGFARTTQLALDTGHAFLARLRQAAPDAEILVLEGNHDARMQKFIETNALASFGLRQANLPEAWPVMSLPNLLRLDELNIRYVDAYPAATDWDNDTTRNIHGTRSNSKGSTMAQYAHELPHISTWAGHTHRAEIVYRTVLGDRGAPLERYAANPGVLCRTDGAVPSVHGALGTDGSPAKIVEDWQQGFGVLYYNEKESWPQVYRIRDGVAVVDGRRIAA